MQEMAYEVKERAKFKLTEADRFHRVKSHAETSTQARIFGSQLFASETATADKPGLQPFFKKSESRQNTLSAAQPFSKTVAPKGSGMTSEELERVLRLSPRSRRQYDLQSKVPQLSATTMQDLRCFSSRMLCPAAKASSFVPEDPLPFSTLGCAKNCGQTVATGPIGYSRSEIFKVPRSSVDLRFSSRLSVDRRATGEKNPPMGKGFFSRKTGSSASKKADYPDFTALEAKFREKMANRFSAQAEVGGGRAKNFLGRFGSVPRRSAPNVHSIKA